MVAMAVKAAGAVVIFLLALRPVVVAVAVFTQLRQALALLAASSLLGLEWHIAQLKMMRAVRPFEDLLPAK